MKYNTEISNQDALPIAYMEVTGSGEAQMIKVRQLYSKKPILMMANCVRVNTMGQIVVENIGFDPRIIFELSPSLQIKNVDVVSIMDAEKIANKVSEAKTI